MANEKRKLMWNLGENEEPAKVRGSQKDKTRNEGGVLET